MDQTELGELLFSAQGRLSRTPFLAAAMILLILALLERALPSVLHWITGWVVYPALFFCGACVLSKRLHDRGRSGWWAALTLLAVAAVWPTLHPVAAVVAAPVLVWTLVELGLLAGEQGANRFGPTPVAV